MSQEKIYINNFFNKSLKQSDPDLYLSITKELERQKTHLELIASENIVSQAVLEIQYFLMRSIQDVFFVYPVPL